MLRALSIYGKRVVGAALNGGNRATVVFLAHLLTKCLTDAALDVAEARDGEVHSCEAFHLGFAGAPVGLASVALVHEEQAWGPRNPSA